MFSAMAVRRPAAPPPGADVFRSINLSPVAAGVDVQTLAAAAGLPLVRPADEVAVLLNDAAKRWLLEATATSLVGPAHGAPPSDRAAFCESVADTAEALLLRLGASAGRFAVTARQAMPGGYRDRTQLDPESRLQDGVANLSALSRLGRSQRAKVSTAEAHIELLLAPLLSPSDPRAGKCGVQGAVAITPDVIERAIAGVELLKRLGRLSADAWRIIGKDAGGSRKQAARLSMARALSRIYEHAFGCPWQEAGAGKQSARTYRFVRFLEAFADAVANRADPATLHCCLPNQGPDFRARTAKNLVKLLQRETGSAFPKTLPDFGEPHGNSGGKSGRNR